MNYDGSVVELFISFSKEDDVKEIVGEVDQTLKYENKEPVKIEIVKEEVDNPSDENYSIILAESDDEKEEKEGTAEKDFHFFLIWQGRKWIDWRSSRGTWWYDFSKESKRLRSTYILWN